MAKRIVRQHVVSRFYLKGFADESDQVRRVALPGDRDHLLSINNATVIKDFYSIVLPDGTLSDAFEHAFNEVETPAAEALRLITQGTWPITGDDRFALSTWIALQHLRSEDIRTQQSHMNAQMIKIIVGVSGKDALREVIEKAEGRPISQEELDAEWQDLTKPEGPDLVPNAEDHLRLLTSLLDRTSRYFYDCHWTQIRFSRKALITSDHPVSLLVGPEYPSWSGVGLATADLFMIPLSRRIGLNIQPRNRLAANIRESADFLEAGTTRAAKAMNQETAVRARTSLYHHPEDTPLTGLVLPAPEAQRPKASSGDHLITEKGLFHGMTDEQKRQMGQMSRLNRDQQGMSIHDLTWPIPGRKTLTEPPRASPSH